MVDYRSLVIGLKVQDGHFRAIAHHEPSADCSDELLVVLHQRPGEAVHSEVDGRQVLDVGVVREDADVGSRTQTAQAVDQLDVVRLQEDQVGCDLE
jgi:hypothetical protein